MSIENSIKLYLKSNYAIFKTLRAPLAAIGYYKRKVNSPIEEAWTARIKTVVLSPDNQYIRRVANAGEIKGDIQTMHNGIKIHVGSYYGDGNTVLLHTNQGVHEPQEEKVFDEIIEMLPPNSTMLELGAFWAFYSMSFQKQVRGGISYLIEPDPHALLSGKNNFRLNNLKGYFYNYYVSDDNLNGKIPTITIDRFLQINNITRLSILHSDIQGFELKMLRGAAESLKNGKIDYVFISTHGNDLHYDCINLLTSYGYRILCDANLDETYSWDGLIVARHETIDGPNAMQISKKTTI